MFGDAVLSNSSTSPSEKSAKAVGQGERSHGVAHNRRAAILKTLKRHGGVVVTEIASDLGVSEMTIRRDLVELERDGQLQRTHGGAVPSEADLPMDREEPRFDARLAYRRDAKERIADAAALVCAELRTIALDVGTTTYLLAERLVERSHAKVFTNSLRAASVLSEGRGEVYVAGGRLRREELAIGGGAALAQFGGLWFDVAFVGVSGITASGLFDYSFEDADVKQLYLKRSALKVVLCDSSKFQRMSLVLVAPLGDADLLITDHAPPPELAAALKAAGVEVLIAAAEC